MFQVIWSTREQRWRQRQGMLEMLVPPEDQGMWGGLQKDVGLSRRGCRWSHRVIHAGTLTIHWCGFSLMGLRHRRGGWITMVFTVQSNYRRQLGRMLHQLQL